jgi:hypothetical protein
MSMRAMILCDAQNSQKILADWTPKAGCTIAMKMLFSHMNVLEEALAYKHPRKWVHDFRVDVYYDRFGVATEQHINSDDYIKLKFVRNPFNRAVSSYIHCCKFPFLLDEFAETNPSFNDFLILLHSKQLGINCGGGHYRIQNWNKNIEYDHIIQIENINDHIKEINKLYNLNLDSEFSSGHHVEKSNYITRFGYTSRTDVLNYFENNFQHSPVYESYYSDENYQLVSSIYSDDITPLGYTFGLQ